MNQCAPNLTALIGNQVCFEYFSYRMLCTWFSVQMYLTCCRICRYSLSVPTEMHNINKCSATPAPLTFLGTSFSNLGSFIVSCSVTISCSNFSKFLAHMSTVDLSLKLGDDMIRRSHFRDISRLLWLEQGVHPVGIPTFLPVLLTGHPGIES